MTNSADSSHPFDQLTPDFVIAAVEAQGYLSDGRLLALNSYENRVYQVGIEDSEPLIAKFYRPGRWSDAQIEEEHEFCHQLREHDLPVVAPLQDADGNSLHHYGGLPLALFPRRAGRAPELESDENLKILGRTLGQMHCVGRTQDFSHRPALSWQSYGVDSVDLITDSWIPDDLRDAYQSLCRDLLNVIEQRFNALEDLQWIRCHSDCHLGNILWREGSPNFVDFDDARMAPAIQDLWMFLSGDRNQQAGQLKQILAGYELFNSLDLRELQLIEPLRTLRMMHHSAWLARRWNDPAFPKHFNWFSGPRYWGEHILELREQFALLQEPALEPAP